MKYRITTLDKDEHRIIGMRRDTEHSIVFTTDAGKQIEFMRATVLTIEEIPERTPEEQIQDAQALQRMREEPQRLRSRPDTFPGR